MNVLRCRIRTLWAAGVCLAVAILVNGDDSQPRCEIGKPQGVDSALKDKEIGYFVRRPWSSYHGDSFFYPGDAFFPCSWPNVGSHLERGVIIAYQDPPFRDEGIDSFMTGVDDYSRGFPYLRLEGNVSQLRLACAEAQTIIGEQSFRGDLGEKELFVFIYNRDTMPGRNAGFGLEYNEDWHSAKDEYPLIPPPRHKMFIRCRHAILDDWEYAKDVPRLEVSGPLHLWANPTNCIKCNSSDGRSDPDCAVIADVDKLRVVVVPSKEFESYYNATPGKQWVEITTNQVIHYTFGKEHERLVAKEIEVKRP